MNAMAEEGAGREVKTFLDAGRLATIGPKPFARTVERLLWHLGFDDVRNIDGPGDEGGDILAHRKGFRWVFQCKWKSSGLVGEDAVRQVDAAKAFYGADRAVVVTNRAPGRKAIEHRRKLLSVGVKIDFWDDGALAKFAAEIIPDYIPARYDLYDFVPPEGTLGLLNLALVFFVLAAAFGLVTNIPLPLALRDWLEERRGDLAKSLGHEVARPRRRRKKRTEPHLRRRSSARS